jgi:hypothetical protein
MLCIGERFISKPFREFQPFTWSIISNLVMKPIHVCFWHLFCVAYELYELSSFLWNLFLIAIIDLYVFLFAYSYTNTITIILACVSFGFCLVM